MAVDLLTPRTNAQTEPSFTTRFEQRSNWSSPARLMAGVWNKKLHVSTAWRFRVSDDCPSKLNDSTPTKQGASRLLTRVSMIPPPRKCSKAGRRGDRQHLCPGPLDQRIKANNTPATQRRWGGGWVPSFAQSTDGIHRISIHTAPSMTGCICLPVEAAASSVISWTVPFRTEQNGRHRR